MSRHTNVGQNHDIKIDNTLFERVAKLKCLQTTVIDKMYRLNHKEVKMRINPEGACYY
jgi:hypothetical protein